MAECFLNRIIKKGGTDVSDTTAVATDVLASKDFYLANGTKTTGTIATYSGDTEITENATLETEGKYLASDIVVDISDYVRPTGAPDTDTIAQNAPDIEDSGTTYKPLYAIALMDTIASKAFTKTGTGVSTGGDAYVFSDEPSTLYVGDTTHTFDTTDDISTSENWKARYVIVYGTQANKENASGITVNLYSYTATYEFVGCANTIFSSTSVLFCQSTDPNINIKYIDISNSSFYNNTISADYFCRDCCSLIVLDLPTTLITISGTNFCRNCYSLKTLNLQSLTTVSGRYLCASCFSLKTLNLQSLTTVSAFGFFQYCASLTTLDLPAIETWTNTAIDTISYTQYVSLPTDFDINAVNLTGATGYSKSIAWFHHLATQLKDNSGGSAKSMILGAENIALIPSADATTISNKNWTLS